MAAITVGNVTAVDIPVAQGAGLIVQNLGTGNVYLGNDSTVTTLTGIKLLPGANYEYPRQVNEGAGAVWAIADAAGQDVRYMVV